MRPQHALVDAGFLGLGLFEGGLAQRVCIVCRAAALAEALMLLFHSVCLFNCILLSHATRHLVEPGYAIRIPSLVECLAFVLALGAAMQGVGRDDAGGVESLAVRVVGKGLRVLVFVTAAAGGRRT